VPSPFNNVIDGGGFQDGYSTNTVQGLAASEIHTFSNNLINEFRFGVNYLDSTRYNLNYNTNVSANLPIPFPGVPYTASLNDGGLPTISFTDGIANIGSTGYQPAIEKQHSYVFTENLNWIHGRHAAKFGGELRFEQFTILEPGQARGSMDFGSQFTDNPGAPVLGTGGDAFASFLLGLPSGGFITTVTPNIDYRRQIYSAYANDDFKVTPRLTLNLGLRYEFFSTVKEANNEQATFDFNTLSLVVPSGQSTALTPLLASEIAIQRNGSPGLISPDTNNFAPASDWPTNCPTSSSCAAATASSMAARKAARSPTQAPASTLRTCLRRHSTLPVTRQSQIRPWVVQPIARSRPRTTPACRSISCLRAFPPPHSPTRTHPSSTRSIRILSPLTPSSGTWVWSTNCPPTPSSKFPTEARAD
jgi:hypothetical protein